MDIQHSLIYYIPIVSTIFCVYFSALLFIHWLNRKQKVAYLFVWSFGVFVYGLGTLTEALTTLFGWQIWLFKSWYIFGALLGGAPLAQGTIFLLASRRFAWASAILLSVIVTVLSIFVVLSPIDIPKEVGIHLSADVLTWQWIRNFSPFINIYAAIFLIGELFGLHGNILRVLP